MDVDEIKADLTAATDEALRLAEVLASAVESEDLARASEVTHTLRAALRRTKNLRRALVAEVAG